MMRQQIVVWSLMKRLRRRPLAGGRPSDNPSEVDKPASAHTRVQAAVHGYHCASYIRRVI